MFDFLDLILPERGFDGPMQMALDEVLLGRLEKADHAMLRIYEWATPCVSFGYFQKIHEVRKNYPSLPCVRRWTGGGMVMHGTRDVCELTFSLIIPQEHPVTNLSPAAFYKILHGSLIAGIKPFFSSGIRLAADADRLNGVSCFLAPAHDDLLCCGKKILGGAQRRSGGALLYQGSLQGFDDSDKRLALAQSMSVALSRTISKITLNDVTLGEATRLAETRYGAEAWTYRR